MKIDAKCRKLLTMPRLTAAGVSVAGALVALYSSSAITSAAAQPAPAITISSTLPSYLPSNATITEAAVFAWQEFIALNWPAVNQTGVPGSNTRGVADNSKKFGDDSSGSDQASQPVVWETYRGKVETFPGVGDPPGYGNGAAQDYGFDVGPQYIYGTRTTTPPTPPGGPTPKGAVQNNPGGPVLLVPACQNPAQTNVTNPSYVNLDEITQIGLDSMFAGILPSAITNPTAQNANAAPSLIRFLAKGNRTFYDYVAANQYWYKNAGYQLAQSNFATAALNNSYPPPTPTMSLPNGTVLVKAAWRPLAPGESASDFHTKTVRFYDQDGTSQTACYREQIWALIALHIIQKAQNQPNFIFATFEYTSNILTSGGKLVENNSGAEVSAPAGDPMDPRLNYFDIMSGPDNKSTYYSPDYPKGISVPPQPPVIPPPPPPPPPPAAGTPLPLVQVTAPYCQATQDDRLYFQDLNLSGNSIPPANSGTCVNKRYFAIPPQIQQVNAAAHAALNSYAAPALWQNYKLINVQWQPFDLSEIDTTASNTSRLPSTFNLSNSVVETDNTLQQFFGGLFGAVPQNGFFKSAFENFSTSGGKAYNIFGPPTGSVPPNQFTRTTMGGCMGCHGRAQRTGTDFSFTLSGGPVDEPEFAVPATAAAVATATAQKFRVGFDEQRLQVLHDALAGR